MKTFYPVAIVILLLGAMWCVVSSQQQTAVPVEVIRLTDANWDSTAPRGKEVDAIIGDLVIRNRHLVAVIAQPIATRNVNVFVKSNAGTLIDLTTRENQSDQLSAYYPGQREFAYREWVATDSTGKSQPGDQVTVLRDPQSASITVKATASEGKPAVDTRYTLTADSRSLEITSTYRNETAAPLKVKLIDDLRYDTKNEDVLKGADGTAAHFTIEDRFWHQAYAITTEGRQLLTNSDPRTTVLKMIDASMNDEIEIPAGGSFTVTRRITAAATLPEAVAALSHEPHVRTTLAIQSATGQRLSHARVEIRQADQLLGTILTDARGEFTTSLKPGSYSLKVLFNGAVVADAITLQVEPAIEQSQAVRIQDFEPGTVIARITDGEGQPIPCKVSFDVPEGVTAPHFGPDTAEFGVRNLRYTPNGEFQQLLAPGTYKARVSHGPEYDSTIVDLTVEAARTAELNVKLPRVVDTTGWVSGDFHSHASPSGDNTTSQLGRVLNLTSEHIEFAPCTEHNRISSYDEHIDKLKIRSFMATCTGMEMTGTPLPLNHQNAFPLHHHPHRQDGGGPTFDDSPEVQIERLALWDNRSEKLVQQNHPDVGWLFYDRNGDGEPDDGYAKGFAFMDVMEVHPLHTILDMQPTKVYNDKIYNNTVFNWLQLLNQGHKVYGVVNTDAHYNFHGSGGIRNWIQSSTDDPAKIDTLEMVHASEQGRLIMSNGPFLEVWATEPGTDSRVTCGQSLVAKSKSVELSIRVQCPNWIDVDRVFVLANGRIIPGQDYTREKHPDAFGNGVIKFDRKIPVTLEQDAHLIVVAASEKTTIGPIAGPEYGKQQPTAIGNPIFVDVAGDGFQPNKDTLGHPLPVKQGGPAKK